jgi:hypothetical protein
VHLGQLSNSTPTIFIVCICTLHFGHWIMGCDIFVYRIAGSASQQSGHLATVKKTTTASSAMLDDKIRIFGMLPLFQVVATTGTWELGLRQVYDLKLHRILTSAPGKGSPLISVQPNTSTGVALIDLNP